MRRRWTEKADSDLDQIAAFYTSVANEWGAAENVVRLLNAVAPFDLMPKKSRPGRVPGTRALANPGLPYSVSYCVVASENQILRVFHTARKPPKTW